jgi:hypothetical protein
MLAGTAQRFVCRATIGDPVCGVERMVVVCSACEWHCSAPYWGSCHCEICHEFEKLTSIRSATQQQQQSQLCCGRWVLPGAPRGGLLVPRPSTALCIMQTRNRTQQQHHNAPYTNTEQQAIRRPHNSYETINNTMNNQWSQTMN